MAERKTVTIERCESDPPGITLWEVVIYRPDNTCVSGGRYHRAKAEEVAREHHRWRGAGYRLVLPPEQCPIDST